jgi:hypothetical protein
MGLLGRRWLARAPNQFVTAPFVPRRCGKTERTFDLAALAPTIHTREKFRKKNQWTAFFAPVTLLHPSPFQKPRPHPESRRSLRLEGCTPRLPEAPSPFETPTLLAPHGGGLGFRKSFESGPHAVFCPISGLNRTKMFHVKHFGTIDSREHRTRKARNLSFGRNLLSGLERCGGAAVTRHVESSYVPCML